MALTMTRTRTQTALTKLVELVANVHGEMELVEPLLAKEVGPSSVLLAARKQQLEASRDALYLTLRQFDPELNPSSVGISDCRMRGVAGKAYRGRFMGAQ